MAHSVAQIGKTLKQLFNRFQPNPSKRNVYGGFLLSKIYFFLPRDRLALIAVYCPHRQATKRTKARKGRETYDIRNTVGNMDEGEPSTTPGDRERDRKRIQRKNQIHHSKNHPPQRSSDTVGRFGQAC